MMAICIGWQLVQLSLSGEVFIVDSMFRGKINHLGEKLTGVDSLFTLT